jgi:AAA+ ATPase superfamily predicted ATPase
MALGIAVGIVVSRILSGGAGDLTFPPLLGVALGALSGVGIVILGIWLNAGFEYATAGGDAGKTQFAQKTMVNATIGLILIVVTVGIAFLISGLLGVASDLSVYIAGGSAVGVAVLLAAIILRIPSILFWPLKLLWMLILRIPSILFWPLELLWMLILFVLSRHKDAARWLRYLPTRFDKRIIFPLPFMGQIILEAYRENSDTARETIDYLITSTNQQNVAAWAMTGIAVDSLSRCQSQMDIANITDELAWIPSPPPKQLGSVLPQLLDISQGVRASVEATSPYRKYELLKPPITALRELLNSLAFNGRSATTFASIAQHWLTILETAQHILQEQARYSKQIRQVYIAGNALDPQTAKNRFKGRIDLFREIERLALENPPPVLLLYGGRRTGKTSALKYLPHKVGATLVPLLVDLQGAASAETLSGAAEALAKEVIEAARRLPRRLDLPYPDKNKLAKDPFPALQDWFGEIERTAPNKRFLLCLDEFERLSEVVEVTRSRAPLNFLRHVLQHRAAWTLLFSGFHQPKELPDYWSDYLINTRTLRVSYLDEESARELIVQPVEDFTNIYEPTAIDTIIHLTHCQPYLVQLTCYEIVELLNRDIRENRRDASTAKATAQDVETVIPTVLERGGRYFDELWKSLADSDRNLLLRLVQGETPTPQDKAVLRKLERKEILQKTEPSYSFQVPLVQKYVEQVVEEEE